MAVNTTGTGTVSDMESISVAELKYFTVQRNEWRKKFVCHCYRYCRKILATRHTQKMVIVLYFFIVFQVKD